MATILNEAAEGCAMVVHVYYPHFPAYLRSSKGYEEHREGGGLTPLKIGPVIS